MKMEANPASSFDKHVISGSVWKTLKESLAGLRRHPEAVVKIKQRA